MCNICRFMMTLSSSGYNLMLIHAADMNTDTLVMFWFICLVCWFNGFSVCLTIGRRSFSWLRKVPGPVCVPSKLFFLLNASNFLFPVIGNLIKKLQVDGEGCLILFFFYFLLALCVFWGCRSLCERCSWGCFSLFFFCPEAVSLRLSDSF